MAQIPFKFELGQKVRSRVTGIKGVIMCRTEYYTGCLHYSILPDIKKKDETKEPEWISINESLLDPIESKNLLRPDTAKRPSGLMPPVAKQ